MQILSVFLMIRSMSIFKRAVVSIPREKSITLVTVTRTYLKKNQGTSYYEVSSTKFFGTYRSLCLVMIDV